jgi:hypothetical protein
MSSYLNLSSTSAPGWGRQIIRVMIFSYNLCCWRESSKSSAEKTLRVDDEDEEESSEGSDESGSSVSDNEADDEFEPSQSSKPTSGDAQSDGAELSASEKAN